MENSDWVFISWIIAAAACLLGALNQAAHLVAVREGPQYVCAVKGPPDSAQALGAVDMGYISGERTFFPPTFVCGYPDQIGGQPSIFVDMYPAGPWIFWISLAVIVLAAGLALVLQYRAQHL
ncbi:hypothetical protein [Kocuria sp. SM24M-10]|uniref:hypothetical protein n=1 Tax=Kocuria sp. SM24M-10 TaxID=1660349 RepID=UPI0006495377|nr:hypothetical protein [Kocuria sp. SM24M-10]KLU09034.1 hypothetical protein ABL57_14710 [Kocuria sp. SM24M-10]